MNYRRKPPIHFTWASNKNSRICHKAGVYPAPGSLLHLQVFMVFFVEKTMKPAIIGLCCESLVRLEFEGKNRLIGDFLRFQTQSATNS
jgi:hypothetical protein